MFFILSKTLNYLTMPFVVAVLCLILSAALRKQNLKKLFFRIGLGILLFCSNDFIANEMMRRWELAPTPYENITRTYELGILLTGVAKSNTEPKDRVHFARGADRAVHTVDLYKRGIIKKILISGGEGKLISAGGISEAEELSRALLLMGVPEADMLIEGKSRNTHESAVEVKKIIDGVFNPSDCLLITSGFHMRRSRACFTKVGLPMDTFSAETLVHKRSYNFDVLFIPKVEAITLWHSLVKEWVGMIAYKVAGYI